MYIYIVIYKQFLNARQRLLLCLILRANIVHGDSKTFSFKRLTIVISYDVICKQIHTQ